VEDQEKLRGEIKAVTDEIERLKHMIDEAGGRLN